MTTASSAATAGDCQDAKAAAASIAAPPEPGKRGSESEDGFWNLLIVSLRLGCTGLTGGRCHVVDL